MSSSSNEFVKHYLDDQRQRWKSGDRVKVESYLAQEPQLSGNGDAVLDLIYHEMVLREASGEMLRLEEYLERFPKMADQLKLQFQFHQAMDDQTLPKVDGQQKTMAPAPETFRSGGDPAGPTAVPNLPGYDILNQLGQGGMGVVYRARHIRLNRIVALKMIRGDRRRAKPEQALREMVRFRLEAEAVAKLKHPHVVQIHEFGEFDGGPFFSLEYVEGGNLHEKLAGRPMPPQDAARLVETLARAVHFAHLQGIVHRDLKPANVLLDKDGTPKITDFGLAKFVAADSQQTGTEEIVGTPAYMSPEQADRSGRPITPAVDIYALGAVLYECLTGKPPFRGEDWMQTLLMVIQDDPVPPRQIESKIPFDLDTICLKCLAKEPAQRYSGAEAMADDLRRYLANEPIQARPTTVTRRFLKWTRRHPAIASMLALSLLLVVTGVGAGFWIQTERAERAKTKLALVSNQAELDKKQAEEDARLARERADRDADKARQVNGHLDRAAGLLGESKATEGGDLAKLREAEKAAAAAAGLLAGEAGSADDRKRADELLAELKMAIEAAEVSKKHRDMVAALEDVRFMRKKRNKPGADIKKYPTQSSGGGGTSGIDYVVMAEDYGIAFLEYGIDVNSLTVAESAARIQQLPIKLELTFAIDHWSMVRYKLFDYRNGTMPDEAKPGEHYKRLLRLANIIDNDDGFRSRIRTALMEEDPQRLLKMAEEKLKDGGAADFPVITALLLASGLDRFKHTASAVELLRVTRYHHPKDFWVHHDLAGYCEKLEPPEWDQALRHYSSAFALDSTNVDVISRIGWVYYQKNDLPEALRVFNAALQLDSKHANSHYRKGLVHGALKDYPNAIKCFEESVKWDPQGSNVHTEWGKVYNTLKDYKKAIGEFEKALALHPNHGEALFGLGFAHLELKENQKAVDAYQLCVRVRPDYLIARYNLALAYERQEKFDDALREFEAALRISPKDDLTKQSIDRVRAARDKALDKTIESLKTLTAREPKNHKAFDDMGKAYFDRQLFDKAAEAHEKAIQVNDQIAAYHVNLAKTHKQLRQYRACIASATRAIELDKKLVAAYFYRGYGHIELKEYREAAEEYSTAIELAPDVADYYNERGFCHSYLNQHAMAVADFSKAAKLVPTAAIYMNNLGWAYLQGGNPEEAVNHYHKAIALDSGYTLAYDNLGTLHIDRKEYEKAVTILEKAIKIEPNFAKGLYLLAKAWFERKDQKDLKKALEFADRAVAAKTEYALAYFIRGKIHRELGNSMKADQDYRDAIRIDPSLAERSGTDLE